MTTLEQRPGRQPPETPRTRRRTVALAGATVLLVGGTAVGVAAANGAFSSGATSTAACGVPSLPGAVVTARLMNMGGTGMHGTSRQGSNMGMGGSGMHQTQWPNFTAGMMRLVADVGSVPAGRVSVVAANLGTIAHELVVLPLTGSRAPGTRTIGADGRVSEAGSLGEASASCAAGAGDGIAARSSGWVTLDLKPGRYELVCNLAGHYRAGMYAELDVT